MIRTILFKNNDIQNNLSQNQTIIPDFQLTLVNKSNDTEWEDPEETQVLKKVNLFMLIQRNLNEEPVKYTINSVSFPFQTAIKYQIQWFSQPKSVVLIKKWKDKATTDYVKQMSSFLQKIMFIVLLNLVFQT